MDDSCAVCTETLEWVAYGPCRHREVCSTCVVRLRFVLGDRRCCICKTECPVVFVTKALGDCTRIVVDFSVFAVSSTEGQVGRYWYHEDTQAYFDDMDQYKVIKAMCLLSCSVCDKNTDRQGSERSKRRARFRSIEQLKGHLFHQHKLVMCKLCLEGKKVFTCEQKLYTRSQLNQHMSTGDSEVDGSESDRGGFMGHPMCKFCRKPFYGDHEHYMHMSTVHYTCHICRSQHAGQYDYYRNYNDLEMHFRQDHFLCENQACLERKFVFFQTEAEMKRHNVLEHGEHMSHSKRNAALRIPTSFRYQQNEQEHRRGRGRGFHSDPSVNQLSMGTQANLETALTSGGFHDSSSSSRLNAEQGETSHADVVRDSSEASTSIAVSKAPSRTPLSLSQSHTTTPMLVEFPPFGDRDSREPSYGYAQALSQSSRKAVKLEKESFPPLPGATGQSKPIHTSESFYMNSLAVGLQRSRGSVVTNSAQSRPPEYHGRFPSFSEFRATPTNGPASSTSSISQMGARPSASSACNSNTARGMRQSTLAPNLAEGRLSGHAAPCMNSAVDGKETLTTGNQSITSMGDVYSANKSLVERIRADLGMDEGRYGAFKIMSSEYRRGLINTWEYLSYVEQFGLSHLGVELARLCPDAQKEKELIDAFHANMWNKSLLENGGSKGGRKGKGKGKAIVHAETRATSARDTLDTVRKVEDGCRIAKDKLQSSARDACANSSSVDVNLAGKNTAGEVESVKDTAKQNVADGGNSNQT
ncbi:unnamed protein product [Musa banksii]